MSLRDRARQAAREERARAARQGPTEMQIKAAGTLSELLDCEIDPLDCEMRWEKRTLIATVTVDDVRLRMWIGSHKGANVYEVEAGRGALRRWAPFTSLAELDALLD